MLIHRHLAVVARKRVSSSGWDVSTASYDSKSVDVSSNEIDAQAVFFKPDGTKMYVVGVTSDTVYQYGLSTAWDVSTASYDSKSADVSSQEAAPVALSFKDNGTKLYVLGHSSDTVYQYSLSTAWDVSTASYDSKSFDISTQEPSPGGLFFKDDGTKMYVVGSSGDAVYQYTLSTAWDVSSASYDSQSADVSEDSAPQALFFRSDGAQMFVAGSNSRTVYQYTLSTAWDVSTASYDSKSFSVFTQETLPTGLFFKSDGTKMYVIGQTDDTVYQYSLSG